MENGIRRTGEMEITMSGGEIIKDIIKAIKYCKTCQCNECPFKSHVAYCFTVLEYLTIKDKEDKGRAVNK